MFGIVSLFVMVLLLATVIIPAVDNSYERETMDNPDPTLSLEKYYRTIFFNTALDLEVTDAGDDQIAVRSDSDTQTVDFGPMIITAADNSTIFIDDYDHIICAWSDQGYLDYEYLTLPVTAVTSGDIVTISSNGSSFTIPKPNEYLYKPQTSGQYGSYDHGDLWTSMHIAVGFFAEPVYNELSYSGLLNQHITESDGKLQSITWDNTAEPQVNVLESRIVLPEPQIIEPEQNINVLRGVPTPTYSDGDWGYNLDGDAATIVSYSGSPGNITVPATVGGYDVVAIGVGTLDNTVFDPAVIINSTVTIPGSIKTINTSAFKGCSGLTSVTLNEGLETINNVAFRDCTGLTSITIPSTVTTLGSGVFMGCSGLTSMTLNEGLTSIGQSCFQNCTSLTSITIPSTVTTLGLYCFRYDTGLTSVTLNEGLTTLNSVFVGCSGLTTVSIPSTVTNLNTAFQNCTGITSMTVHNGVSNLASTFNGCTGLTSVILDADGALTAVGSQSIFYGCTSLTDVTIKDGVNMLGQYAFRGCTALKSITIPSNVETLGNGIFYGCTSLSHVRLSEGLKTISQYAFQNCTTLKSITIPSTVTSIGGSALKTTPVMEQILNLSSLTITTSMTGAPLPAVDDHIDAAAYIAFKEPSVLKPGSQYNAFISIIPIVVVLLILVGAAVLIISRRE